MTPPTLEYARGPRRRWWPRLLLGLICIACLVLVANILSPRPQRSYDIPPILQCQSHLREIGQAMLLYAYDFGGRYPDNPGDLLLEEIGPEAFICPNSSDTPAQGPTTQPIASQVSA